MNQQRILVARAVTWCLALMVVTGVLVSSVGAADLEEIQERGVLRHLGIPYANFVTGSGDGMDVELIKLFAQYLGVKYQYVQTSWKQVIGDLTGIKVKPQGNEVQILGQVPIRGDIVANGFTILPWRQKVVDYSTPTFPTQVWLIARADSTLQPIVPSGDIAKDIAQVKLLVKGYTILGKANTCIDPTLYGLKEAGAKVKFFFRGVNELAPAVIKGDAESTLLDVPDALIALEKWPGQIKVIGPLSPQQNMGCAFAKTSRSLRRAFNQFLEKCKREGTYLRLVKKYYPSVVDYYPKFFAKHS
ncbi:MAG: ABC transporter substrate-binding protein [Desulfobacca sp. 4484_104]|nr:MAG: ABC transporter substrate-binding protein [Desulfobacca sp. 4484_104]RLA87411.1 MAG: ABC transporter substrate-binding protein [Deltaproteobacteria bacterium]